MWSINSRKGSEIDEIRNKIRTASEYIKFSDAAIFRRYWKLELRLGLCYRKIHGDRTGRSFAKLATIRLSNFYDRSTTLDIVTSIRRNFETNMVIDLSLEVDVLIRLLSKLSKELTFAILAIECGYMARNQNQSNAIVNSIELLVDLALYIFITRKCIQFNS